MKVALLILSLVLNAALLAVVLRPAHDVSPSTHTSQRTKVLTTTVTQEIAGIPVTNIVQAPADLDFHWSSIQSTNFNEYTRKLVEIGCPSQTIRDIITGEIDDWMLNERRQIFAPYAPRFWEFAAKGKFDIPEEIKPQIVELEKKRRELLTNSLSGIPATAEPVEKLRPSRTDPTLAMLPAEKLEQLKGLDKKYSDLRKQIREDKSLKEKEKNDKYQQLQKQQEAEKQGLMSPEELAEYKKRRESHQFANVYGFQTTPEELQKIAEVYAQFPTWATDPDFTPEGVETRSKEREEALKALLGEQRLAEYKRGQDNTYQQVWQVTQAYGLPQEAAIKAYELQKATTDEAKAIRSNKTLSKEQQTVMLDELQDQFEDATAEILGEQAAESYNRHNRRRFGR